MLVLIIRLYSIEFIYKIHNLAVMFADEATSYHQGSICVCRR